MPLKLPNKRTGLAVPTGKKTYDPDPPSASLPGAKGGLNGAAAMGRRRERRRDGVRSAVCWPHGPCR